MFERSYWWAYLLLAMHLTSFGVWQPKWGMHRIYQQHCGRVQLCPKIHVQRVHPPAPRLNDQLLWYFRGVYGHTRESWPLLWCIISTTFRLPAVLREALTLWSNYNVQVLWPPLMFAVGRASMEAYSCVFFHGWRAATHRAMSGGINCTQQMLWTESWQIMCGPVSTPICAIQWTCRRW
jgi:hypothetical protein